MPEKNEVLAIMFADICRSTSLYDILGDQAAQKLVDTCLSHLMEVTKQNNGTVIKTIGDEVMCTFPSANLAVDAACAMHTIMEEVPLPQNAPSWFSHPSLRIGIHFGPVIRKENDIFGDAVNVAARIASLTKPMHTFTTQPTVEALPPVYRTAIQCIDRGGLKGKRGELNIYEVVWQQQDLTMVSPAAMPTPTAKSRLQLQFQGKIIELDMDRPRISIGRHTQNEIEINNVRVSRTHAVIEYRRGKFLLIDQSSNGTFLILKGQKPNYIFRNEEELKGNGLIGCGNVIDKNSPEAIQFTIFKNRHQESIAEKSEDLAILFANICHNTSFYEILGDQAAQKLVNTCLSHLTAVTKNNKGTAVKIIGNEVMCAFPSANLAVDAACAMHTIMEDIQLPQNAPSWFSHPNLRIGIHFGTVIRKENDIFGDAVNVAAKIAALAKPLHTFTTQPTVETLPPLYRAMAQCIDRGSLPEQGELNLNIYEVVWQQQDLTMVLPTAMPAPTAKYRMQLQFQGKTLELDMDRRRISIGRLAQNDIQIIGAHISRTHAVIEYRKGEFVLIDQSANGTLLIVEGKAPIRILRNEKKIVGSGLIGCGKMIDKNSPEAIQFTIFK
ncbi:adenylate/guanylate cyclase domain-containing protein [Desulfococcaceae bacterium HSG9]|nr:adenylate/guanylate cyclase domain-containing protein [Desulfococcaceae bacterium HSG9]